ncbi:hypothetical protein EIN_173640 [Entamoeba invadens IP1]|uniref:EF-hand domain-containing protein n=1 Tax=Entamoeba invadens IP1 TaxID=370355 RepID=A0A0A1TVZ3_ENTIV|nr:hypothetical protein EIN_173640 [Entamoeba invadens IP1]ELP84689.1 hypothetical protein EIN_173640 [Entamoeba invadens IP1]|eukprot:XP_004184035.1 hypothetical protein EIN_173640 [Entamoeba invadens IP1]
MALRIDMFDVFDKNKSGYIEPDEFVIGMRGIVGSIAGSDIEKVYTLILRAADGVGLFDARDRKLNRHEFEIIAKHTPNDFGVDKIVCVIRLLFDVFDTKQSGFISVADLDKVTDNKSGTKSVSQQMRTRVMQMAFKNGNNSLNFTDFVEYIKDFIRCN